MQLLWPSWLHEAVHPLGGRWGRQLQLLPALRNRTKSQAGRDSDVFPSTQGVPALLAAGSGSGGGGAGGGNGGASVVGWVEGVVAETISGLQADKSGNGSAAATAAKVGRLRGVLLRQPAGSAALPLHRAAMPPWAAVGRPSIAGLLLVRTACRASGAAKPPHPPTPFSIALHDPRPEAGTDFAPLDGGKSLRWL
eukprot:SAG11_NODE_12543_length_698_cov_0.662771_1_plen_194_part_01